MRGSASENVYLAVQRGKILWYKEGHTERLSGMFLPKKGSFPGSLQKTFFASPAAPFTMLLYRSREVSSQCSGTIEHIFQSPVSKGVQAPCCHGHLQTQGLGPGSVASARFQGRLLPLSAWYKQGCLSRWLHHFGALFPLLRASLQDVSTWARVFTKVIWILKHSDSAALAKDFNCILQALCSLC